MRNAVMIASLAVVVSAAAWGYAARRDRPVEAPWPAPRPFVVVAPANRLFLMPIEDIFSIAGRGTVVTGRIESGSVRVGDEVEIVGLGRTLRTRVRGVEMFRKLLNEGHAGDNVGILLSGVSRDQLRRGQVLAFPGTIAGCSEFEARVSELPPGAPDRFQYYFRTADVAGRIAFAPGGPPAGGRTRARISLAEPIAMNPGQQFNVRQAGRTLGSGTVTQCLKSGDGSDGGAAGNGSAEIGPRVRKIVADLLKVEPRRVTPAARFKEDLGADSLDFVELVMAWEEEFGIEMSDAAAARIRTVGDAEKEVKAALFRPAG